jgi:hypothetical protein
VAAIESWWRMSAELKELLQRKWAAEDKAKKEQQK